MVKLLSKNSNLCDHNSPTSQTDRRTDGQTDRETTCDRNTALCTKVHRAGKSRIDQMGLGGQSIHEKDHLDWTSSFQCSFETVDSRLINIIIKKTCSMFAALSKKKYFLTSSLLLFFIIFHDDHEWPLVLLSTLRSKKSNPRIMQRNVIQPSIWLLPVDQLYL